MVGNAAIADYLVARVAVFVGNTAQPRERFGLVWQRS